MIEWNVYRYNINRDKIESFNIFNHWTFCEYTKKAINKYKAKEDFEDQLKRELSYYFWSKCEHELVIEITKNNRIFLIPWAGCREPEKVKIDVTDDGNYNWKTFANIHTNRQRYGNKAKIDIYDQVMFKWEEFVDYCWVNKKEILKIK